jgi:hypothetical protein
MSKESKLLDLATSSSMEMELFSDLAGFEGVTFHPDSNAHLNITESEYVYSILSYAENLTSLKLTDLRQARNHYFNVPEDCYKERFSEAWELIKYLRGYNKKLLEQLARADWKDRESEDEDDEESD